MKTQKTWKSTILIACLFLTVLFVFPTTALADGITGDDTVEEGEVLDQNVVLSGPVVVMDGVINGDLLAVGNRITINGEVNGTLVAVGQNVILNGPVAGNVYLSALTLVVGPGASIGQDVYFIGGTLETQDSSAIGRDLNVISLEANLSGSSGREVNALVGPLNLIRSIYEFMISRGWLPPPVETGAWFFPDGFNRQPVRGMAFGLLSLQNLLPASRSPAGGPAVEAEPAYQAPEQGTIDVERLQAWAIPVLRNLAALLILGLLGVWLVPAQLDMAGEQTRLSPWRTLLTGVLVFFLGWVMALLVFVLVLALAFFLFWLSLPGLGFLAGTLGLTGLGLAVSIFWLAIAFFSKIIIALLVGRLLFKRFLPKYAQSRIWPLLTGVVLYVLIASIPYLGWAVAVITTFLGLGALWMVSTLRGLQGGEAAPAASLPGEDSPEMGLLPEAQSPSL